MLSRLSEVPDGLPGVAQIVDTLNAIKTHYGRTRGIRSAAVNIVRGAGEHDQAQQIHALAAFVRGALVYLLDPLHSELVHTPDVLLLEIARHGVAYGDCDDHCVLFAALAESIGIPCDIVGVNSPDTEIPDHVITVVHLDSGDLDFDLIAKGKEQPSYADKLFPAVTPRG